jgi:hypothetical protein
MNSMTEKTAVFPDPHAKREKGERPVLSPRKSNISFEDATSEVMERTAVVREYLAC